MNYEEFKSAMMELIISFSPDGSEVSVRTVRKNNGVCLDGLTIMGRGENAAPTFYLQYYYERYRKGAGLNILAKEIMLLNEHNPLRHVDVESLTSYDAVRDHLFVRLINYDMNAVLLRNLPHIKMMDLALVFYYRVDGTITPEAAALVHDREMEEWGITKKELYVTAMSNAMTEEPVTIGVMADCPEMHIITNDTGFFGASVLAYPEVEDVFEEHFKEDMVFIPSSIHEIIAIPKRTAPGPEEINAMVRQVNADYVSEEEILSGHVYYFDRAKKEIYYLTKQ